MLSDFSKKLMPSLKENQLVDFENKTDVDNLLYFIESKYNYGDFIYPSALHRKLKIDLKLIYSILEQAVISDLLEQYLQLYCYHCQKYAGTMYKHIVDIPQTEYCLNCDEKIVDPFKYTVIIYKVK